MDNIKVEPNTPELSKEDWNDIANGRDNPRVDKIIDDVAKREQLAYEKRQKDKVEPNTPELMAEYLIENHRPYADATETNFFLDSVFSKERETKNAIQSAIVSAEVALNVAIDMNDFHNYRREAKITFWEQTIKYLNDKL